MMKRFKLSMIIGLLGLFGFTCFSNGYGLTGTSQASNLEVGGWVYFRSGYCYIFTSNGENVKIFTADGNVFASGVNNNFTQYCNDYSNGTVSNKGNSRVSYLVYPMLSEGQSCPECQSCPSTSITLFHGDSFNVPISGVDNNLFIPIEDDYTVSENQFGGLNFSITHNSSLGSGYSQLFINDIEHNSAPIINVSIPEEINWNSSIDSGEFYLTVSGQNVDYEYIDGIIRTQKSSPNSTDFNNIITGLIPLFVPGLVIILFLWFIFKFIKKIF